MLKRLNTSLIFRARGESAEGGGEAGLGGGEGRPVNYSSYLMHL